FMKKEIAHRLHKLTQIIKIKKIRVICVISGQKKGEHHDNKKAFNLFIDPIDSFAIPGSKGW
ncbi:hypothetical protein ACFLRT_04020, partial [Acidobacteriota bacterium]